VSPSTHAIDPWRRMMLFLLDEGHAKDRACGRGTTRLPLKKRIKLPFERVKKLTGEADREKAHPKKVKGGGESVTLGAYRKTKRKSERKRKGEPPSRKSRARGKCLLRGPA